MDQAAKHETTVRVEKLDGLREIAMALAAPARFDADDEVRVILTVRTGSEDRANDFYARLRYLLENVPGAGIKGVLRSLAREPQAPLGSPSQQQLGEALSGMALPDLVAAFDAWALSPGTNLEALELVGTRIARAWRNRTVEAQVRAVLSGAGWGLKS